MNWGKGIALVYITFVIGMLGLVYLAVIQDFDLVAEDYYEQEIAYQGRIDQMTDAQADGQRVQVIQGDHNIQLNFSSLPVTDVAIHFFRPSDETKDFQLNEPTVNATIAVPTSKLSVGKYLIKVEWKANGKTYFQEQDFIVI